MNGTTLCEKRIVDLVSESYIRASVLYYFGIRFFEYNEQTLAEVCRQKGLKIEQVVQELENNNLRKEPELPLLHYPIDLIIEYLKHTHFTFIKHKLPYISKLVESLDSKHDQYQQIARDLKMVFPLFVEDFIHHIYEEEDTLFRYINQLEKAFRHQINPGILWQKIAQGSLQQLALEHECHDDEMEGIRKITQNYELTSDAPLHIKVIYSELLDLEKQLIIHASVENEILFPRAMALEARVKEQIIEKSRWN